MSVSRRPLAGQIALLVAVGTALVTLPSEHFSVLWLAVFALPGAAALVLLHGLRWSPTSTLLAAVAAEVALSYWLHSPSPQSALTYLLLAPLAFAVLRRRGTDLLHGLFLALCLLLVGAILRHDTPWRAVVLFALAGAVVLHADAAVSRRLTVFGHRLRRSEHLAEHARLALLCVATCLSTFVLLGLLPPPGGTRAAPLPQAHRVVGLTSDFDLSAASGSPLDLIDDELVRVTAQDAQPVPDDLYLRCGAFDVAGLDRWRVANGRGHRIEHDLAERPWVRPPVEGVPSRALRIERLTTAKGFVFVPPGLWGLASVRGGTHLRTVPEAMSFAEIDARGPMTVSVRYQDLAPLAFDRDTLEPLTGLTDLPSELRRRSDLAQLADRWASGITDPAAIAHALMAGLRERCSYRLEEPSGTSTHALDNFLFGSRSGYCMHFASALAILLRLRDVPCRVAVGLYGGERHADGSRIYGSQHAHAWVEVPLAGLGWVVFDPTPPNVLASTQWLRPRDAGGANDDGSADEADAAATASWPLSWPWARAVLPWLALLLLGFVALSAAPLRGRRHRPRMPPTVRSARALRDRLLAALAARGMPRAAGESLERYAFRLQRSATFEVGDAIAALRAYQEVRFGARPLDEARAALMRHAADSLRC